MRERAVEGGKEVEKKRLKEYFTSHEWAPLESLCLCLFHSCRLSSECGSLHESLAGVEERKRELEMETGRLEREMEEERRRCEHVEREGREAAEVADNRAKQQVCHEALFRMLFYFHFLPSCLPLTLPSCLPVDHFSSQVKLSAQQLQQVVEENKTLQERLARVEG